MGMTEGLLRRWGRDRNRMLEASSGCQRPRPPTMAEHHPAFPCGLSMQSLILGPRRPIW